MAKAGRRTSRVVVVVPIKPASRDRVEKILAEASPLRREGSKLTGQHVFATENEVVFVLEATDAPILPELAPDIERLATAETWGEHIAGPARVAEAAFSWSGPESPEGVTFAPTPGPGDSEGGDVYPP